jgi:hypothetical protein
MPIVHTLIPNKFEKYVKNAMEKREKEYVVKKSMNMKAKPEFVQLFEESGSIASKYFIANINDS